MTKLSQLTTSTQNQINSLQQELEKQNNFLNFKGRGFSYSSENLRQIKVSSKNAVLLKNKIEILKSLIPWTEGTEYKNAIKRGRPTEEAITKQLEQDRRNLFTQFSSLDKTKRCILGGTSRGVFCDKDDILKLAENTPQPNLSSIFSHSTERNSDLRRKISYTHLELQAQNCSFNAKVDQLKTSDTINSNAIQAILLGITGGIGSAPFLARFLASRALIAEKTVENVIKSANLSRRGIDGSAFLKDTRDAVTLCEKYAAQTPTPSPTSSQKNQQSSTCQSTNIYEFIPQIDTYKECITSLVFVGVDGTRLALGEVVSKLAKKQIAALDKESENKLHTFKVRYKKFLENSKANKDQLLLASSDLDDPTRLEAAKIVVARDITFVQSKAILAADKVGSDNGYHKYSRQELSEKYSILINAGFSKNDANALIRSGITGKFSNDDFKLAEKGLLNSQLKKRNEANELSDYFEDSNHWRKINKENDALYQKYNTEINNLEIKKSSLSQTSPRPESEIQIIDAEIKKIEDLREKLYSNTFGKENKTLEEHLNYVRHSIAKKTEEIELLRQKEYGGNIPLSTPSSRLNLYLKDRQKFFENEALLNLKHNPGDPADAVISYRRAIKDLNEQQNMGYLPKSESETERALTLRSVAQDFNGFNFNEIDKLIPSRISALEEGKPFLRGSVKSSNFSLPLTKLDEKVENIWKAYIDYTQRVTDQQILDTIRNNGFFSKYNLDPKKLKSTEEKYLEARDAASERLSKAVESFYGQNRKKAEEVLRNLTGG